MFVSTVLFGLLVCADAFNTGLEEKFKLVNPLSIAGLKEKSTTPLSIPNVVENFQSSFRKFQQNSNLDSLAATATGYLRTTVYLDAKCSTPYGELVQIAGVCGIADTSTIAKPAYYMASVASSDSTSVTVLLTNYSTSACSGKGGKVTTATYPVNTCISIGTMSGKFTYSTSAPSISSNAVLTKSFSDSGCMNEYQDAYTYTGCGTYSSTTSISLSCSGNTYSLAQYASSGCSGTPVFSVPNAPFMTCTQQTNGAYDSQSCFTGTKDATTCFAGSESVMLESGNTKLISEVKVGDVILAAGKSGKTLFSEVIAVPHKKNSVVSDFSVISTESGRDIKMTPDHLIMSGSCDMTSVMSLVRAGDVTVNACVQTIQGNEKVVSNILTRGEGVYTVVTKEEFVVVNGVIASPFAGNHAVGHAYYNLHRSLYSLSPLIMSLPWMKQANEIFGSIVSSSVAMFSS